MPCNYKIRHTHLEDNILDYCRQRIDKIAKLLPDTAFIEVEFIDEFGERGGNDKHVQVDISVPGEKCAIHLENSTDSWQGSIDLLQERLEKEIIRQRERDRDNQRYPKKYKAAENEERSAGEIS